jgi:DNA-binding SARP family transcriptional activator
VGKIDTGRPSAGQREGALVTACRLTLLGGFSFAATDGAKLALPTRKDKLLLAYLALSPGRPQSRERLAGLLWGDRGEAQARDSLKQSLAGIRQAFRQAGLDPLRADREFVTFDPAGVDIDAVEFALLATHATTCAAAIALYRGDLLDGIDGAGAEFEDWLRSERERLSSLAARALQELAQAAIPDDLLDEAIRFGSQLLARDRLREPVYRALMRLHVRKGDRPEALKLYAACRETLKRELGVAPDAGTEHLYRDILTDRVGSPPGLSEAARAPDRPSIAVLPFSNLSGDAKLEHLCEGITEETIIGLGRFRLLFVIDRHSSSAVSRQISDVAEIGRRLGVGYLVQGSLQQLGERLRITVRLIDAATRSQVWGETYDCPLDEVFAIRDRSIGSIVSTLHNRVEAHQLEQVRRRPAAAAYECLIQGVKHLRSYGPDDNQRAVALFQRASDLDPNYALAQAYRAFADVVLHGYADSPPAVLRSAVSTAERAVELDDDDGRCHWLLGMIHEYNGDLDRAEYHHRRAIALNPNDANAIASLGPLLTFKGRAEEAIDRLREAMRFNPYHPDWYWSDLSMALYATRRYAEAIEALRQITRPGYWQWSRLAACHAQLNHTDEARAAAEEVRRLRPNFSLASIRWSYKNPADAAHVLEGMRKAGLPE